MSERTKSQIGKHAKRKGSSAQRNVAKVLGLWLYNDPNIFHSTPASGGLRWKSDVAGTRGDIVAPDDINFPYSIEIKNQEGWDFHQLFQDQGKIPKWWKQTEDDAKVVDKLPCLIFTRNNLPYFTMLNLSSLKWPFWDLNNNTFDLAINSMSFGEMKKRDIEDYFRLLRRCMKKDNIFYCVNRVEKIMEYEGKSVPIRFFEYPIKLKFLC